MADLPPIKHAVGDRSPAVLVQLKRGDGTFVDLSAAALSQVKFHFRDLETQEIVIVSATTFVAPLVDGFASYTPSIPDTAAVRTRKVTVKYENPAASGIFETFPICDLLLWHVLKDG